MKGIALLYITDGDMHEIPVTYHQLKLLKALMRGAKVYRPAREPAGTRHDVGRVKIQEKGAETLLVETRDVVPDTLIARGLLEATATRVPGGFRVDYTIPQGLEFLNIPS